MNRQYEWSALMKKLIAIAALVCLISSMVAAAIEKQSEGLEISMGPEWKEVFTAHTRKLSHLEFIRVGDDIGNWKELVNIFHVGSKGPSNLSYEKNLENILALREKLCPGATTQYAVIEKSENSILYEWQAKPCLSSPEQHEIGRMMSGTHERFFLHYAAKGTEVAPAARAAIIKTFSAATIDSGPSAIVPSAGSENVDEVVPFAMDKVVAAVKPAMEKKDCHVVEATSNRVECKRPHGVGEGGESVTAELEAQGEQTRVRIWTGKGFYGRLAKENWSARIYEDAVTILQPAQP
jgi:hypothetical protein